MRQRHLAGLAVATVIALGAGLPAPVLAVADGATLFVNPVSGCTDTGSGTQAAPFCTIQAAVDAAQPGQTVQVAAATYREQVTLTHSGEPGKPITVRGGDIRNGLSTLPLVGFDPGGTAADHGFVLNGVHDVTITGLGIRGSLGAVQLADTQLVTLDGNIMGGSTSGPQTAGIHLSGTTASTTISRNIVRGLARTAIVVDAGVTGTILTTNAVDNQAGGAGIQITDAPGTVITSNTVSSVCGPAIGLLGNSSKAVVENNVLATGFDTGKNAPACDPSQGTAKLSVSADSVPGTVADYNLADPFGNAPVYNWAGTSYATAADFTKAVPQQGAHDITADPHYSGNPDTALPIGSNSPGIDSADANAPGELTTDLYGYQRIDDPAFPNTGTGSGYYDRGAFEFTTSSRSVAVEVQPRQIPAGASTTLTLHDFGSWSPVVSYTVDFGDGTPTVTTTQFSVQHTYQTAGSYQATVVATEQNGDTTTTGDTTVQVSPPGLLVPKLTSSRNSNPLGYDFSDFGSTSPWSLESFSFDFGDGSSPVTTTDVITGTSHTYANEGDYTVTLTVTDTGGRSEKTSQLLHVAYQAGAFHPTTPMRLLDTRTLPSSVAAGGTFDLQLLPNYSNYFGYQQPTAVVLNVTAVSKGRDGHVTVYPTGSKQPTTSSVNYVGGQAVPNLITVPVGPTGAVSFANSWGGDVDLVVDISGFYSTDLSSGSRFTPLTPARLVDTRNGDTGGKLGPDSTRNIKVAGSGGVPANATAVILNLTGTDATETTHLDVAPSGTSGYGASNLNPVPGQDRANQVIVPLGPDGSINVYNHAGSTDIVLDVFGYYSPDGKGLFTPTTPTRLLDTRTTGTPLSRDSQTSLQIAGTGNVPANATGAVLNVTATDSTAPSYLTVFPDGQTRPGTSNLNAQPGVDVPNHVTTPLGTDGRVDVYNHDGTTDVLADLLGYFTAG
ncbi:PKD domain-containing protein [Kitasatospora sp. NBC_01266]|uniref:PKD domain-containing protein n=1 Tax=Kitasatospora sp. NBC_01266 TaxID=2903572 RepID=UPI002E36B09A|nr:PKD domain-containing protein [Kitasatospora sp. NBC_01266]